MRKKLLSMLVMLAAVVTGAVAQTDLKTPLTLEAKDDGTIITIWYPQKGMQYSISGSTKIAVNDKDEEQSIEVNIEVKKGDMVTFYGNGTSITSYSVTNIQCYGECYIYGNIMSLVNEDGFATATALEDYAFQRLFAGNSNLYSHPTKKLVLPATTLAAYCYSEMFDRCINLTTAPELPATTLAESCYESMFSGCTNLTTVPEKLPATTLAVRCYNYMFFGCTSLTTSPKLPATDLALSCYNNMFNGCTSLTTAPELPATTLAESCYYGMFEDCTSLTSVTCLATNIEAGNATSYWLDGVAETGTFIKAEDMESWTRGGSGIPSDWTPTDYVTLTDRDDIETPLSKYAGETCWVNYTRSFTSGKPSTVCLPFAYTPKTGEKFYTFTGISKDGSSYTANMTEVVTTPLAPNTPYLFMPTGNADFSGTYTIPASITAGTTTVGDWTFVGTYTTKEWETEPTGIYGFSAQDVAEQGISQGQFVKAGEYVRIQPMRCYLENEGFAGARGAKREAEPLPETIKVRLISANGEVTGIGSLLTKTGEVTIDGGTWYSIDGRRIAGKPSTKGIYVNNGNKVIIK